MDSKPKLYARLRVKTGSYEVEGKTKNRYSDVGVLFASPHFSNMYMQIDTLPIKEWDGRIYVDPVEQKEDRPNTQNEALEQAGIIKEKDIEDRPVDLSEIPF